MYSAGLKGLHGVGVRGGEEVWRSAVTHHQGLGLSPRSFCGQNC